MIRIVKNIDNGRMNLLLHIQVAGVGLTVDNQHKIIANTAVVNEVNRIVQARFGDDSRLKIADIIENKPMQGTDVANKPRQSCWIC